MVTALLAVVLLALLALLGSFGMSVLGESWLRHTEAYEWWLLGGGLAVVALQTAAIVLVNL